MLGLPNWQSPENPFTDAAAVAMCVLMLAIWVVGGVLQLELRNRGYSWWPMSSFRELRLMVECEPDPSKRRAYSVMRRIINICLVLFFIVPSVLLAIAYLTSHGH